MGEVASARKEVLAVPKEDARSDPATGEDEISAAVAAGERGCGVRGP